MILLAAMDPMGLIGNQGKLPWNFPQDMLRFRNTTNGHIVIMGRKTWDSLPRKPLSNRVNVVFSRTTPTDALPGAIVVRNIEQLCEALDGHIMKEAYVIGGSQIYTELIDYCHQLIITHVKKKFVGDTYFLWDWCQWEPDGDLYQDSDIRIVQYKRTT